MKKKTAKKQPKMSIAAQTVATPPQAAQQAPVSPDLVQKVQALRGLATTHNVLDKGFFPRSLNGAVDMSVEFIRALYENLKSECLAHPDADRIPELVQLKGQENV